VQRGRCKRFPTHQVETEVADVGASLVVDHHVVQVAGRVPAQVGVGDQAAVGLAAQDPAVAHRDHQQPPVGQPAEAGRLLLNRRLEPEVGAVCADRVDLGGVEVGEPEPPLVPAGRLGEFESVEHGGDLGRHRSMVGPYRLESKVRPAARRRRP
jgi:hypothetical protein